MKQKRMHKFKAEDFTVKLAIMDVIPMVFFLSSMILTSSFFQSILFTMGATCSLIAGFSKVLWKFILGLRRKNVEWLSHLFIPFQCIGFTLIIASLVVNRKRIHLSIIWQAISSFPSSIFLLIGLGGMIMMIAISFHFDQSIKSHWKAQIVNAIAQCAIFVGLLFLI